MIRQISIPFLFALQCFLITNGKNILGSDGNPFVLCIVSLLIAYLYYYNIVKNTNNIPPVQKTIRPIFAFLLGLVPFIILVPFIHSMFQEYANYRESSDVIPQLDALYTRWQRGEFPYHSLPEYSWRPFPVYMPLNWFPLAIPHALNIDLRWIGIMMLIISNGVWAIYVARKSNNIITAIIGICTPALALAFYLVWARFDISITIETIICAYYLILAAGLASRNIWLITAGIILCLLSRYVLVFWLPLFAVLLWMNKPAKINVAVWGSVLLAAVFIYIIPFYAVDTTILKNGIIYHNECAIAEWNADPLESWTFKAGIYFAPYIKALTSGSMEHRVFIARCVQGIIMLGLCISGVWLYRKKRSIVNFYDHSLLFLYLTVLLFYMFSPLTYKYYYIVLLMLSAVLCFKTMNLSKTSTDKYVETVVSFRLLVLTPVSICWLRRDLRLDDNAALYHALKSGHPVVPVFIYDTNILEDLEDKQDRRVDLIHQALQHLQAQLVNMGSTLHVYTGTPPDCFKQIAAEYSIAAVYTNHDYEPYAKARDKQVADLLKSNGIDFHTYKDQVLFEKDEVVKDNGAPYTVYTPYSRKHKAKLNPFYLKPYPTETYFGNFYKQPAKQLPSLESIGFQKTDLTFQVPVLDEEIASHYHETRDIPSIHGTTHMGAHLRFGTISIRKLAAQAMKLNEVFLNELLWRDFYHMILWHFPKVVNTSFHEEYDNIKWRNNEQEFARWCEGQTGYPIVDAGMRELNQTGFMHNRVRMIVASFLTKHLLIDWRWGEAYFSKKLLDYDLASNNGNWQWAAGCGCDAAPYFRVFNPYLQTEKFDTKHAYIKKWVPEYEQLSYPQPVVIHEEARERCLRVYKAALGKK